ncbi:hypothetical protein [Rubrivivax gelatinosus]|uniref:hypothetical protein n=1 Tax=Rubrivivax gelatinosus TaxID=28068 RepID=UPI0005C24989|nr:hypothetical protein [Rubrivivax gelatinosus]MBG6083170.1 multidrug efflux pump subunit AcrA (membrane-fusion protein) [Rubrivivax gelatinosus]
MALTPEQKAANKAARKAALDALQPAYKARREQYESAKQAAEDAKAKAPETLAHQQAMERADKAREDLLARKAELDRRIRELQEELRCVSAEGQRELEPLREACSAAWARMHDAKRRIDADLRARFPDMEGVYMVTQWDPTKVPSDAVSQHERTTL